MPFPLGEHLGLALKNIHYSQVVAVARTQRGVIQSPQIWSIQIIQKSWVDDLLDGDATNILRGQERKRNALYGGRNRLGNVHSVALLAPNLKLRTPNGLEAQQLDLSQIPNFSTERVDRKETRDHVCRKRSHLWTPG